MNSLAAQLQRNDALLAATPNLGERVESRVLPFRLDLSAPKLDKKDAFILNRLEKDAARIALCSLASLAKINELDHLGGGLELIPSLLMTLAVTDYEKTAFTIEHAHTSIGYYAALAALGFLERERVIEHFRRSLDIAGHVSWVPGGTELNGGRLGVMVPAAVGQALGLKARHGEDAFVVCHCGDAGWISGQALNGFNGADLHKAPITFVMHRNGIQLSGSTRQVMDKDPRPILRSLGLEILEIPSLHDKARLFKAYQDARALARQGRPSLIYPVGYRSGKKGPVTLRSFGNLYGIAAEVEHHAGRHGVSMDTEVWIPGSLMSWRDVHPMIECVFLVNGLPGGEGHHDGHMKGRELTEVLANPMFAGDGREDHAMRKLTKEPRRVVVTAARPAPGSPNLELTAAQIAEISLPGPGKTVSARAGVEAAYAAVAKAHPQAFFNVSCDLDPSTKLGKASALVGADHVFQMSIEEQAAALLANGLALSSRQPQLNVFATFSAFFEGIAREAFEMWRYTRNLNGRNEGLNVTFHLSHVGACTGRDHFSGWSLDWISLAMGYLPYLRRFYAPCDARQAFVAVRDLASRQGAHIIGIPRDNLPVLTRQGAPDQPLWNADSPWEDVTVYRHHANAKRAVLALGAPAYLAGEASDALAAEGLPVDVIIVNALPLSRDVLNGWFYRYSEGLVTLEDGLIAHRGIGLRGFASLIASQAVGRSVPVGHVGIVDPTVAPSHGMTECWEHFGITTEAIVEAVRAL
jgi:transketolase